MAQPSPSPSTAAPSPPSAATDVDGGEADASGGGDGGGSSGDSGGTVIAGIIVAVLLLAAVSVLVTRARTQAKRTRGSMTSAPPVTANPIHAMSPSPVARRQHPQFSDAPGTVDDALDFLGGLEDDTDEIGMATPERKTIAWGGSEVVQPSELGSVARVVVPERVRVLSIPANNNHESAV